MASVFDSRHKTEVHSDVSEWVCRTCLIYKSEFPTKKIMWDNRRAVAEGAVIFLLLVVAAALVTGSGSVPGGSGLLIDGSVFGEEDSDGTVHVPAGKVTSANGSLKIHNEDHDICVGNCPPSAGGGDE